MNPHTKVEILFKLIEQIIIQPCVRLTLPHISWKPDLSTRNALRRVHLVHRRPGFYGYPHTRPSSSLLASQIKTQDAACCITQRGVPKGP